MEEMHYLPRPMPEASGTFAKIMSDLNAPPVVEVSGPDDSDSKPRPAHHQHAKEDDNVVHGLNHCYKMVHGEIVPEHHCKHDHHRLSNGHLDEMSHNVLQAPGSPRRRKSICGATHLLPSDQDDFRPRSASMGNAAAGARRGSMPGPPASRHGQRRGSNVAAEDLHFVYDQYLHGKK